MDQLAPEAILDGLHTELLGRQIVHYETTDSTNAVAKTLAQQGAEEGTLVVAEEQTAGRGRLGRRWVAPRGTSLLFSLIFRPDLAVERVQGLTMVCALGACEAVQALTRAVFALQGFQFFHGLFIFRRLGIVAQSVFKQ